MAARERAPSRLLGLGLDAPLTEQIKAAAKAGRLPVRLSFAASPEGLPASANDVDAFLVQVPTHFGQALKLVQELLFRFPRTAVLVLSPKSDPHLLVHFFRAGVFDVLFFPLDVLEISQALRRATHRPTDPRTPADWTPLQAAAHFFTRPLAEHWDDLSDNLHRYFSLFYDVQKHQRFHDPAELLRLLPSVYGIRGPRLAKLEKFLADPKGLVFGLGHHRETSSWIIKLAPDHLCYWQARDLGRSRREEVFGPGFRNLLRGQRAHFEAQLEQRRLRRLALTDEITGLWNQRRLTQDLEEKVASGQAFALLFIDIDFFKNVNDQFGHVHGSNLLIDMAAILRRELRGSDFIYRYGGDEFIVLLPRTDLEVAKKIAVRLSESVKAHEFTVQNRPYRMSLSVGIAEYPTDGHSARELVDFADKMMYMSKKSGRGKVFHVTEVL